MAKLDFGKKRVAELIRTAVREEKDEKPVLPSKSDLKSEWALHPERRPSAVKTLTRDEITKLCPPKKR